MGVTCHWIDDSWFIQKRIITFYLFDDAHTAHNIYVLLSNILQDYGLVQKILTIGFDNASANIVTINDFKVVCQPNLGGKFFSFSMCMSYFKFMCTRWFKIFKLAYCTY